MNIAKKNYWVIDISLHLLGISLQTYNAESYLFYFSDMNSLEKQKHSFESSDFPSHMEPMMLACIYNKYEIILLMLQKGHRLEIPGNESGQITQKYCNNL